MKTGLTYFHRQSICGKNSITGLLSKLGNYELFEIGGSLRVVPCPISGSEQNAFSIRKLNDGTEFYTAFSGKRLPGYEDVPYQGTVADLVWGMSDSLSEVAQLLSSPLASSKTRRISKSGNTTMPVNPLTKERIHELQAFYVRSLRSNPEAMQYLTEVRGLSRETITLAGLGWSSNRKAISYPFFSEGFGTEVQHIKFKMRQGFFGHDKKSYTSQLGGNNGGDYLYNAFGLNRPVVWLLEGEHDALKLWQSQKIVAVGISGKCSETCERYRQITAINGKTVIFAFDLDEAGEEYCQLFQDLKKNNKVFRARGNGKDPDEWFLNPASVSLQRVRS
jgi:hypothetical protein